MALRIDSEFCGINVPAAYCVVGGIGFSPTSKAEVVFTLYYKASKKYDAFATKSFVGPYDLTGSNPFNQAYEYLKTLPEFEGSTDC